jgi:hypothetical protein
MTPRMLGAVLANIFSDPVAKEIAMGSIEDFFDATGPGPTGFLTVFDAVNDPPPCAFGGVMNGSTIGLLGFSGNRGPNQQNSYSLRAGVMGAARPGAR